MNSILHLTPEQLRRAADLQDQLASLQKELGQILGASTPAPAAKAPRRKWKMSRAAKAKIAAAQRARWAKQKGTTPAKAAAKPRRKMSAAARKRMAEAAKARWAKAKAAGKTRL
jgi:hypothetical protein